MSCKKPCAMCPCKPTTPESHRDLLRGLIEDIQLSGGFPCHDKHPYAHALSDASLGPDGRFHTTDCAGYKIWGLQPRAEQMKWA